MTAPTTDARVDAHACELVNVRCRCGRCAWCGQHGCRSTECARKHRASEFTWMAAGRAAGGLA